MNTFPNEAITQLSFSMHENKGVFALLLGSGLSRSAEIPTGWEITLDLIRRIAMAQGAGSQADWAQWYRDSTGTEPNYPRLLETLSLSPNERRSILQGYIEPNEGENDDEKRKPTAAHKAIAELAKLGYVKLIITTNFDRLIETALRQVGVEPTVVTSTDSLLGAEPITHTSCYILKLHGDYKDARILNTDLELAKYPAEYDRLLDRVFDEFGLIVCGWSGDWDHALRGALLRAPNRRYSVYWTSRGELGPGAEELVQHRRARVISIVDADTFFTDLLQRIQTLEQYRRRNPSSVELLVNTTKRLMAKSEYRIQLDELFAAETDSLISQLDDPRLAMSGGFSSAEFASRINRYEALTEPLARAAGVLGRWGDGSELTLVLDILRAIRHQSEKLGSGLTVWLNLRSYPAVLIFNTYGMGATRSQRWSTLHDLFSAEVPRPHQDPVRVVEAFFLSSWSGGDNQLWQQLSGLERRKTALSDHLLSILTPWAKSFAGIESEFEMIFERFEILASLASIEQTNKAELRVVMSAQQSQNFVWMPMGRSSWHHAIGNRVLKELHDPSVAASLLASGFAQGDQEQLSLLLANFNRLADRMQW